MSNVLASCRSLLADTLDELAEKLGLPAEELKASVARYNELCDLGYDPDFGKHPKYLK